MFDLNQAALLSIQLLVMGRVHAGTEQVEHRNTLASRGDFVMFTCNISMRNATQISWDKGRFYFAHLIQSNQTVSNFTSHIFRIDTDLPTKLSIFSAQHDDAGLYMCHVIAREGVKVISWNLTISANTTETPPSWYFPYILPPVSGLLLCGFTIAVCICRKAKTRTPDQDPIQDPQSRGEVVLMQPQGDTAHRTNNEQYLERLNSLYGSAELGNH